jgi:DeoR/GlpR family transcriptional regulator of sugar metabolism
MTAAKGRREEMYHLAVTTGLASVEELSRHFNVTASTFRRDHEETAGSASKVRAS